MQRFFIILGILIGVLGLSFTSSMAQVPSDCQVSSDVVAEIRQMLTAIDNQIYELWTPDEIACACIEIYYNDPPTADFHEQVVRSAIILLGKTGDKRAVPVLIDAIETHAPQALYALGNFPTVEALEALTANIRNEDPEARENAAEGLRRMPSPGKEIPEGWTQALKKAINEINEWLKIEDEPTFIEYFRDARANLTELLEKATVSQTE